MFSFEPKDLPTVEEVLEARARFYEKPIATLDFASLYPSMMMVVFVKGSYKEVKAKHPRVTYADLYQRSTDVDVLAMKEALLYIKLIQYVITAKVVLMEAL
ncbi:DNA polymerase delta catalytic subunit [Tanacetum coccineum]